MMKAIKAALDPSDSQEHLRIVCFMTDGEVGNDDEIIAEVQRHPNARVFCFGIGSSVNRALLDKIAQEGKGEASTSRSRTTVKGRQEILRTRPHAAPHRSLNRLERHAGRRCLSGQTTDLFRQNP